MSTNGPIQYSPDGTQYWDGSRWVPVPQPPQQPGVRGAAARALMPQTILLASVALFVQAGLAVIAAIVEIVDSVLNPTLPGDFLTFATAVDTITWLVVALLLTWLGLMIRTPGRRWAAVVVTVLIPIGLAWTLVWLSEELTPLDASILSGFTVLPHAIDVLHYGIGLLINVAVLVLLWAPSSSRAHLSSR